MLEEILEEIVVGALCITRAGGRRQKEWIEAQTCIMALNVYVEFMECAIRPENAYGKNTWFKYQQRVYLLTQAKARIAELEA